MQHIIIERIIEHLRVFKNVNQLTPQAHKSLDDMIEDLQKLQSENMKLQNAQTATTVAALVLRVCWFLVESCHD